MDFRAFRVPSYLGFVFLQEKEVFYGTQIGRSVQEGLTSITVFHERTPSETWTQYCPLVLPFRLSLVAVNLVFGWMLFKL